MGVRTIFIDRLPAAAAIQGQCLGLQVAGLKAQGGVAKVGCPGFELLHHGVAQALATSGGTDVRALEFADRERGARDGFIERLQAADRDGCAVLIAEERPSDARIQGLGCFVNPGVDGHHFADELSGQFFDARVVRARWNPFDHPTILVAVVSDGLTGSGSGCGAGILTDDSVKGPAKTGML